MGPRGKSGSHFWAHGCVLVYLERECRNRVCFDKKPFGGDNANLFFFVILVRSLWFGNSREAARWNQGDDERGVQTDDTRLSPKTATSTGARGRPVGLRKLKVEGC